MKLKKCPFCGSEAKTYQDDRSNDFITYCDNIDCGIDTGVWGSAEVAENVWNKRIPDPDTALDFVNYCFEHEVLEPTRADFAKFQARYGENGEEPNYYQDRRR